MFLLQYCNELHQCRAARSHPNMPKLCRIVDDKPAFGAAADKEAPGKPGQL